MEETKILLGNHEKYKVYTTEMEYGRIIVEFVNPVTIELPYEISFHHCTKIVSDKERRNISFYDKNDNEIVGAKMNVPIDYRVEFGSSLSDIYYSLSVLKELQYKETLKSFFEGEFGEMDLSSESEFMDFCNYYDIAWFDSLFDLTERIQDIQRYDSYCMDFIDVNAMAEDLGFVRINDKLWIDYSMGFSEFEQLVETDFDGDVNLAVERWRKDTY